MPFFVLLSESTSGGHFVYTNSTLWKTSSDTNVEKYSHFINKHGVKANNLYNYCLLQVLGKTV